MTNNLEKYFYELNFNDKLDRVARSKVQSNSYHSEKLKNKIRTNSNGSVHPGLRNSLNKGNKNSIGSVQTKLSHDGRKSIYANRKKNKQSVDPRASSFDSNARFNQKIKLILKFYLNLKARSTFKRNNNSEVSILKPIIEEENKLIQISYYATSNAWDKLKKGFVDEINHELSMISFTNADVGRTYDTTESGRSTPTHGIPYILDKKVLFLSHLILEIKKIIYSL